MKYDAAKVEKPIRSNSLLISSLTALVACFGLLAVTGCGSGGGGGGDGEKMYFSGVLVDTAGNPINEAILYLYETNENTITDESGAFMLGSYRRLANASVYFQTNKYTNRIALGSLPENTMTVQARFVLNPDLNRIELTELNFSSELPEPSNSLIDTPPTGETPAATSGATPKPTPTIPKSGFDSSGNTAGFGIPAGSYGNISTGRSLWNGMCAVCHPSGKDNRSYGQIKSSLRTQPTMKAFRLSTQEIAHLTAYVNRSHR